MVHYSKLSEAIRAVRALGGQVEPIRRTGELGIFVLVMGKRIRVNGRRKDTPRHLDEYIWRSRQRLAAGPRGTGV